MTCDLAGAGLLRFFNKPHVARCLAFRQKCCRIGGRGESNGAMDKVDRRSFVRLYRIHAVTSDGFQLNLPDRSDEERHQQLEPKGGRWADDQGDGGTTLASATETSICQLPDSRNDRYWNMPGQATGDVGAGAC